MNQALVDLQSRLEQAFARHSRAAEDWADTAAMSRALARVRRWHDRPDGRRADPRSIAKALAAFRGSGKLPRFRDLKYVCLGAASIDMDGSRCCLLAEDELRDRLLHLAETLAEPRRQMKCFQALLHGYWSFPLNHPDTPPAARAGLVVLRAWLARRHASLDSTKMRKPDWFVMLAQHSHLLSDQPCAAYVPALLKGNGRALQLAVDDLAIPVDSWVIEEAIRAAWRESVTLGDIAFRASLPHLLAIANGRAGLFVPRTLAVHCIAQLLSRYARCAQAAEHEELFDTALAFLGNPWVRRANWEAQVRDAQGWPDELARVMVGAWLKRQLLTDFFGMSRTPADVDSRRLDYWLRYDPFIDDMWLAISPQLAGKCGASYHRCRRHAKGRQLEPDQQAGDAIFLRIGAFIAVEFAASDQAMLLRWDGLTPEQARTLTFGKRSKSLPVAQLPPDALVALLEHRDDAATGLKWEQTFDEQIRPIIWRSA